MTSKCGKNRRVAHHTELNKSLTFSLNIDVLCDKLLNRATATLTLFVSYDEKRKLFSMVRLSMHLSSIDHE